MLHLRHPTLHAEKVVAAVVVYRRLLLVVAPIVATWRAGELEDTVGLEYEDRMTLLSKCTWICVTWCLRFMRLYT